jgi:Phage integrase family
MVEQASDCQSISLIKESPRNPCCQQRLDEMSATGLAQKCLLKPRDVWAMRFFVQEHRRFRNRAHFDLAIDSKLRGYDIVKMNIGDIAIGGVIRNRATVMQQKTKRPVQFELMTEARQTLLNWLRRRGGSLEDFIFPSRANDMGHLSTRQYARLVDERVSAVGLNVHEYGTHSLRRTKASLITRRRGAALGATECMTAFNDGKVLIERPHSLAKLADPTRTESSTVHPCPNNRQAGSSNLPQHLHKRA